MFNNLENPKQKSYLELGYEKSLKVLTQDDVDLKSFIDIYGEEEIKKDLNKVKFLEQKFNIRDQKKQEIDESVESKEFIQKRGGSTEDKLKFGFIFEALVHYLGEQANWFGSNAFTFHTSKYDDYNEGIDEIIIFQGDDGKEDSYLGLGIDVTTSIRGLKRKLKRTWQEVKNGTLGSVKYFNGDETDYKGPLEHLPKVVIGDVFREIKELTKLWVDGDNEKLAEHPAQFCILDQIKIELEIFINWTKEKLENDNDEKFQRQYEILSQSLENINNILEDKKELRREVNMKSELKIRFNENFSLQEIIEKTLNSIIEKDNK